MPYRLFATLFGALLMLAPASAQEPVPIGGEFVVSTNAGPYQALPQIESDAAGDFVVTWTKQQGTPPASVVTDLLGTKLDPAGTPLEGEFQLGSIYANGGYGYGAIRQASLAASQDGGFLVVWAFGEVNGQRFDSAGKEVGPRFQINSYTTGPQYNPAVASDASGNFVVVWRSSDQDGSHAGIFGQRLDAEARPIGAEFQVNTYTPYRQWRPDVAVAAHGDFVVVWNSLFQDGAYDGVFGQRFDALGAPVGDEFQVNTLTLEHNYRPRVASDAEGNFLVVWQDWSFRIGAEWAIYGQRFDSSGRRLGGQFQVNSRNRGLPSFPEVAADAEGNTFVVWNDRDGRYPQVIGRAYSVDGTPLGSDFLVSTVATGSKTYPAVAMSSTGPIVVWGHGQRSMVVGQRFAPPGLHLSIEGSCPGPVSASILNAPPSSEVAILAAANTNGFVKGGPLCGGTELGVGEPLQLPPLFLIVDETGGGSVDFVSTTEGCHLQALALESCEISNLVSLLPEP